MKGFVIWKLQYPRRVTSRVVKRLNARPPTRSLARSLARVCMCVTPDCHCAAIFFCCYRVLAPHKVSKMENPSPALNGPLCSNSRELPRRSRPPTPPAQPALYPMMYFVQNYIYVGTMEMKTTCLGRFRLHAPWTTCNHLLDNMVLNCWFFLSAGLTGVYFPSNLYWGLSQLIIVSVLS